MTLIKRNSYMKNIAIIISSMGGGGTQQYISSLIDYLANKNLRIFVYQVDYIDNTVMINKAKLVYLKNNQKGFLRNLLLIFSIRNQLKKDKIDKVISFLPKVNCISALANYGLDSQLTVCERNDPIRQKLPIIWSILRIFSYNLAHNITANSRFAIRFLKKWFPLKQNFYYLENYIRRDISNYTNQKKFFTSNSEFTILAVGRLTFLKNYEELIKAFSLINERQVSLIIIGNGPMKNKLNKLITFLNLESKITLLPFKKNISKWFKDADIHIMTSHYEGSPNVLWEASYLSVPSIVSSNINTATEILKDNESVLIYKAGNIKDLADKIKSLIIDQKFRKTIANNAYKTINILSSERVFDKWLEIID